MTITKDFLRQVRADIDAALVSVAKKNGLASLKAANCTYGPGNFKFNVEGVVEGGLDKDAERYQQCVKLLNLPPLGADLTIAGKRYKTSGLNNPCSKVIVTRDDGKRFLYPVEVVTAMAAAQKPEVRPA